MTTTTVYEVCNVLFTTEEAAEAAVDISTANLPKESREATRAKMKESIRLRYVYHQPEHL